MEVRLTKFILFAAFSFALTFTSSAQKDGEYLTNDSPVNNLWESVDGEDGGAPILESSQQFFFLIPDGSDGSMMAPFEMEDLGFACPSYFTVSMDKKYLYLDIHESCELGLPEDELYVKIQYSINTDGTILTLIVDGENYNYKKWAY
ncbi:MAG: hypothetical protein AB8B56_21705 [Crocinitomicaceae bacterium]